jgi:hypothetical protein
VPTRAVFAAFGASEIPERMAGGRGLTWRSGHIVVRPTSDPEEATWKSQVLAEIDSPEGFTVPRPIRDGRADPNLVRQGRRRSGVPPWPAPRREPTSEAPVTILPSRGSRKCACL